MTSLGLKFRITHCFIASPVLWAASFYVTWIAGRQALGYWPRSSLDDPKYIEGPWMWTYHLPMLLLLATIGTGIFAFLSVLSAAQKNESGLRIRTFELALGVALTIIAFALISLDPMNVVEWYLD